jgi:PEP-CTERM motif
MKFMKKNSGMFCGLSRWGMGAVLPALLVCSAICISSVPSAKALTDVWSFTGASVTGVAPDSDADDILASLTAAQGAGISAPTIQPFTPVSPNGGSSLHINSLNTISITISNVTYLSDFTLTYEAYSAAGGSIQWSYTTVGGSSGSLGTALSDGTTGQWNSGISVNMTSLNLSGATSLTFIGTQTSGTSGRMDGLTLTAVPEPNTCALALFGLVFVGWNARRVLLRKTSAAKGA